MNSRDSLKDCARTRLGGSLCNTVIPEGDALRALRPLEVQQAVGGEDGYERGAIRACPEEEHVHDRKSTMSQGGTGCRTRIQEHEHAITRRLRDVFLDDVVPSKHGLGHVRIRCALSEEPKSAEKFTKPIITGTTEDEHAARKGNCLK